MNYKATKENKEGKNIENHMCVGMNLPSVEYVCQLDQNTTWYSSVCNSKEFADQIKQSFSRFICKDSLFYIINSFKYIFIKIVNLFHFFADRVVKKINEKCHKPKTKIVEQKKKYERPVHKIHNWMSEWMCVTKNIYLW